MDISKQSGKSPAPNAYRSYSSFDFKPAKGFTMGEGRAKIQAGDMFYHSFKKPGPSEYNPEKTKNSPSYSMSERRPDLTTKWI